MVGVVDIVEIVYRVQRILLIKVGRVMVERVLRVCYIEFWVMRVDVFVVSIEWRTGITLR